MGGVDVLRPGRAVVDDVARVRGALAELEPRAAAALQLGEDVVDLLVAGCGQVVVGLAFRELPRRHRNVVRLGIVRRRPVVREPGRLGLDHAQQIGRVLLCQLRDLGVLSDDHEHVAELRYAFGLDGVGLRRADRPRSHHQNRSDPDDHAQKCQKPSHARNLPSSSRPASRS